MSNIRKPSAGFSIVELLITLIVIGVVFGAFISTFTTIQTINKKALDIVDANNLAFAKLQEYENKTFSSMTATSPANTLQEVEDFSASLPGKLEAPRVAKVYMSQNTTNNPTLRQVKVSVTFGSGNVQRIIEYSTFIQKNGLGR